MRVISLFNGMGCLRIALQQLNISVDKYYASEIDKFAIGQTKLNFPDIIHLGTITDWGKWDIDWSKIDLIGAGSPCQGFSFAGKQLAFDDPRSKLFFVFVEILNHCKKFNPEVKFLLENVDMKKDHLRIISEYVGVFPVKINSALVSAQNRERWYWTNIRTKNVGLFDEVYSDIPQPDDKGVLLRDILEPEDEVDKKYYLKKAIAGFDGMSLDGKGNNLRIGGHASQSKKHIFDIIKVDRNGVPKSNQDKSDSLTVGGHGCGNHSDMDLILTKNYLQWDTSGKGHKSQQDRAFYDSGKHGTLCVVRSKENTGVFFENGTLRRLTPIECSRLQTIPPWYKWGCSDSQIYRMLGNGWTVDVISHILKYLKLIA